MCRRCNYRTEERVTCGFRLRVDHTLLRGASPCQVYCPNLLVSALPSIPAFGI